VLSGLRDLLAGPIGQFPATLVLGAVCILGCLSLNTLFLAWLERVVSVRIQRRLGPVEVKPQGALQTAADVTMLLGRRLLTPVAADRHVYLAAPVLVFAPTLCVASLIPLSGAEAFADVPYGLLMVGALPCFTALAIIMAGWSSGEGRAVLGAMRSVAQVIACGMPVLLSVLSVVLISQTMNLRRIVEAQQHTAWYVVYQPVAAALYVIGIAAVASRAPFGIPEAGSVPIGDVRAERAGMRLAMFRFAEHTNMLVLGALGATLFLGGWMGPFLPGPVWLLLKAYAIVFLMMWTRWTCRRLRFGRLMRLAWGYLAPAALVNLVATAAFVSVLG